MSSNSFSEEDWVGDLDHDFFVETRSVCTQDFAPKHEPHQEPALGQYSQDVTNDAALTPLNDMTNTTFRKPEEIFQEMVPNKSSKIYDLAWADFVKQSRLQEEQIPTEAHFLGYFDHLWKKEGKASSTLWSIYSRLNKMTMIKYGFKLQTWPRITMLLKNAQQGYKRKRAGVFTVQELTSFMSKELPSNYWVVRKALVAVLFCGGLRCSEGRSVRFGDVQEAKDGYFISYIQGKQKGEVKSNRFFVPFNYENTSISYGHKLKAYLELLEQTFGEIPQDAPLFRNSHRNGKIMLTPMGAHITGAVGKQVAQVLNKDSPEIFTGHCFRRSAATQAAKAGATTPALKTHFGWCQETTPQRYIEGTNETVQKMARFITSTTSEESSSGSTFQVNRKEEIVDGKGNTYTVHCGSNCNVTLNFA